MTVKCTGAEFKAFMNSTDPEFWPEEAWYEDAELIVNGDEFDRDADTDSIGDSARVALTGGIVFDLPSGREPSLEGHFRAWRKKQATAFLTVEVPKDRVEAVNAAIKAAGGRLVK